MFYKDKCTGCGRCVGTTEKDVDFICYNDAKQICGKEYTVDEVFEIVNKDKLFYETSNGGVTFSGGECMMQIDFLRDILKNVRIIIFIQLLIRQGMFRGSILRKYFRIPTCFCMM